jgi:uncharacterized membrane protein YphA (DoxX/SURF4 family)
MKKTRIAYWIVTILFCLLMLGSAIPDVMMHPIAVKGMHEQLGYPLFFIPFIGVAKALGVIAILIPGFPRIKEWAYAGLMFDLVGATYSIIANGQPVIDWIGMLLPLALGAGSYYLYQKVLKQKSIARHPNEELVSAARVAGIA